MHLLLWFRLLWLTTSSLVQKKTLRNGSVIQDLSLFVMVCLILDVIGLWAAVVWLEVLHVVFQTNKSALIYDMQPLQLRGARNKII